MKASINKDGKKARDQKPKGRTDRNWTKLERPRRICSPPQAEFLHFYDEGDASLLGALERTESYRRKDRA